MAILLSEVGERQRTAGACRAQGQVVAARRDGLSEEGADDGQVGNLRVDLGDLLLGLLLQTGVAAAVPVYPGLQQLGHLLPG